MKITITNGKCVPFEEVDVGTVFRDPDFQDFYYIKTSSVVDETTGEEELNCLRLDDYTFECFNPGYKVCPVYSAELIIT